MPKPNAEAMLSEQSSSQNQNMKSQVAPLNTTPYLNYRQPVSKITNATLYQEDNDQNN